ncbi:MAG: phosphate-binding protein, partial [Phycisphaerae bacterium]|nr:phosphate-binding protein [Phycisphaerae bacterium]
MNRLAHSARIAAFALCTFTGLAAAQAVKVDEKIPVYKPTAGVAGNIKSVGSDTMNNLMTLWSEGFKKHYPAVTTEIEGKGSGTAPPALIAGT